MKLTAASSYYDFNSETDALETMQVLPLEFDAAQTTSLAFKH